MAEQSLSSLEAVANDANRTCYEDYVAIEEAAKNVETTTEAYQQSINDLYNENDEEVWKRNRNAVKKL